MSTHTRERTHLTPLQIKRLEARLERQDAHTPAGDKRDMLGMHVALTIKRARERGASK